jgi:hypothetical protein
MADLQRARAILERGDDYYIGALLALERAETLDAREALELCDAELRAAESREFGGIAMKARLLAARAALNGGDTAAAVARWNALEALLPTLHAVDCYPPTAAAIGREALLANGEAGRAAELLATAVAWIQHTAAAHVPDAYRDSFLHRNSVNRALLTAASRQQ